MNLQIIGTSHIAKESINDIKKAILEGKPEVVALELDAQRAAVLLQEGKSKLTFRHLVQLGMGGYLFAKLAQYLQQKLGKMVGVAPGSEMKTALQLAQKQNIKVAFIDQPLATTLKNFSHALTWKEKGRFIIDIGKGLLFPRRQLHELGLDQFDLKSVPQKKVITAMMTQLKQRYPSIYQTLVEDRNKYMVKKLVHLLRENPRQKILVIVGAGHKEGMEELLLKVEVVK